MVNRKNVSARLNFFSLFIENLGNTGGRNIQGNKKIKRNAYSVKKKKNVKSLK